MRYLNLLESSFNLDQTRIYKNPNKMEKISIMKSLDNKNSFRFLVINNDFYIWPDYSYLHFEFIRDYLAPLNFKIEDKSFFYSETYSEFNKSLVKGTVEKQADTLCFEIDNLLKKDFIIKSLGIEDISSYWWDNGNSNIYKENIEEESLEEESLEERKQKIKKLEPIRPADHIEIKRKQKVKPINKIKKLKSVRIY